MFLSPSLLPLDRPGILLPNTCFVIAAWSKDLRELREWEYIGIAIDEPNIPTEIRRMAIEKLISQLEVVNWTGRKP